MPDKKAPTLLLKKALVTAPAGSGRDEIDSLLKENVAAFDETTPADKLNYTFTYDIEGSGTRKVVYTVSDEAGNQTEKEGQLRIRAGEEPTITVDGEAAEWDDILITDAGEKEITVTYSGERYKLEWKAGNKTAAQLKRGTNRLTGYTSEKEKTMTAVLEEKGYYTFLLTTQTQETYRFIIYVK